MDELRLLQTDAALKLAAEDEFQYVPVMIFRPRDSAEALKIQSSIDSALAGMVKKAGKAGLAVMVFMPEAEALQPNTPGPQLELVLTLRVYENPLINESASGTGITAEQCALNILSSLHHWTRGNQTLVANRKAIKPVDDKAGRIVYDVNVRQDTAAPVKTRCSAPVIVDGGLTVSITSATEAAAIYYTQDGSTPAPGNAAATLYAGAFEPVSQATIRAAAYKSGLCTSSISETQV